MNKRGVSSGLIGAAVIIVIILLLLFLTPKFVLDGKAIAPPPTTPGFPDRDADCGNDKCERGENYYNCCQDCCGEENDQVASQEDCCEGLTAVEDVCERPVQEFCKRKKDDVIIPVIPPMPPSTEAIREFPTGKAIAPPPTMPIQCWFCVNCGDGKCSKHETGENCPIDCAVCGNGICEPPAETYVTCPQDCCAEAGYRGAAVVNCCEGLTKVDPCDVEPQPDYCMLPVVQEACINCGDGKCEEYETVKNCPQDCIGNVTSCDELPTLNIDILDRGSTIKFIWEPNTIVPNSNLYLQESKKCVGENCEWGPEMLIKAGYQPHMPNEYSIDMPQENLQFYQLKAKVRVGPKGASCEPQCLYKGTKGEGWYDPCTEPEPKLLKYDICSEKQVFCCFIGTRSEGFYDIDCKEVNENNLISYDTTCHLGAKLCEQTSNLMVKYTQKFERPSRLTAKTGINWMWFSNIHGITNTEDLLKLGGGMFDYVARWDPEQQKQFGSARGNPQLVCKPGNGGKGGHCNLEYVVTGKFNLEQGKPYFVSLAVDQAKLTYVGNIPERVTFELKVKGTEGVNYIVLPLDTTLKKASQLCKIKDTNGNLIINPMERIYEWNPTNQLNVPTTPRICQYTSGNYDVAVDPGKIYLIRVQRDASWQQI